MYKKEIIVYIVVGILTTLIGLIVYYFLTYFFLNPVNKIELQCANIITWIISVIFAFFANRVYVFHSCQSKIVEAFKFIFARISSLLLDMALMFILVSVMKFNHVVTKLFVQIIVILTNYILSKFLVFKKEESVHA